MVLLTGKFFECVKLKSLLFGEKSLPVLFLFFQALSWIPHPTEMPQKNPPLLGIHRGSRPMRRSSTTRSRPESPRWRPRKASKPSREGARRRHHLPFQPRRRQLPRLSSLGHLVRSIAHHHHRRSYQGDLRCLHLLARHQLPQRPNPRRYPCPRSSRIDDRSSAPRRRNRRRRGFQPSPGSGTCSRMRSLRRATTT